MAYAGPWTGLISRDSRPPVGAQDERWVVKIAELPHRLSSEGWKPGILANTDMIAMLFNQ